MNEETLYTNLIAAYLAGELPESEAQQLLAWVHASSANEAFFEEMVTLWEQAEGGDRLPFEPDFQSAWNHIQASTAERTDAQGGTVSVVRPLFARTWVRVAAAIALLIAAGVAWQLRMDQEPEWVVVETAGEQVVPVTLPDGSAIWLNEHSRLSYPEGFDVRSVRLEGEASFDIARDASRPFTIDAGETRVQVLGTSFVVRAYPAEDRVELTVKTGKVAFGLADGRKELKLEAGQSAWYDEVEKTVQKAEQTFHNSEAWRTDQLAFSNETVGSIRTTLERYFDVQLHFSDSSMLKCYYTGKFEQPDLADILEVWQFMFNWEVARDGNEWQISGAGCE